MARERESMNSRRDADQNSNLTGAPPKPEWATGTGTEHMAPGTSIFDPTLCELVYRWFSPPGGIVLDPFAGGSVRGIATASAGTGRQYDRRRTCAPSRSRTNRAQVGLCKELPPVWHVGDSRNIDTIAAGVQADLIFSCPPYADLEVYSDDPLDISAMAYPEFLEAYREIIAVPSALLWPDRSRALQGVGEVRAKDGFYYGFVPDTISAFQDAGARYYNEAILVTALGSLPIRAGKSFMATRKLGKTHQNLLVFCNGDPRLAAQACGVPDFGEVDAEQHGEGVTEL